MKFGESKINVEERVSLGVSRNDLEKVEKFMDENNIPYEKKNPYIMYIEDEIVQGIQRNEKDEPAPEKLKEIMTEIIDSDHSEWNEWIDDLINSTL